MTTTRDLPAWAGTMTHRSRVLAVSSSPPLVFGRFRCAPDDPAWQEDNDVGGTFHIAFPLNPVAITPAGEDRFAADQQRVVFHDPQRPYRRAMLDPRGSACWFVATRADLLAELGDGGPAPVFDTRAGRFTTPTHPLPQSAFTTLQALGREAGDGRADGLAVQSALLEVLRACGHVTERPASVERETTRRAHARLVEDTREVLAGSYRQSLDLGAVADRVGASPFHLHRVFRRWTGTTVHAHREQLRLRDAYTRIVDGAEDLAALAYDLGFSSHSHFTARFRAVFGATPSEVRASPGREPRGPSKMLTVTSPGRS